MNEKEQIIEIINNKPKHYSTLIKKDPRLWDWVCSKSNVDLPSEKIYQAITTETHICQHGNRKNFGGINVGYAGCGTAKVCKCNHERVSKAVSTAKSLCTDEKKLEITAKRKQTMLDKYGVESNMQRPEVKEAHALYYQDTIRSANAVVKYKTTMIEKYGVDNPQKIEAIRKKSQSTLLDRYGASNPQQIPEFKSKAVKTKKDRYHSRYLIECSYEKMIEKFDLAGYKFLVSSEQYIGVKEYYTFEHSECGNVFDTYIDNGHMPICPVCYQQNPTFVSKAETEIADWIKSLGLQVFQTQRQLIAPLHIDIYLPELNLAIEYCGLYWHSETSNNKRREYHLNKLTRCIDQGIDLITIFEDEWLQNKELVKSTLLSRMNNVLNVYPARKCKIVELTNKEVKDFVNNNHLQGHTNAKVTLGLTYNNDLVSIMSFGKPRYTAESEWELLRYCTKQNTTIIGGSERLWRYFIKNYSPISIISYCDRRWFTGKTYLKLGMELSHYSGPNYWYTDYVNRYHRTKFTKRRLISEGADPTKTEREIMKDRKYDRIWDCGNAVFKWHKDIVSTKY